MVNGPSDSSAAVIPNRILKIWQEIDEVQRHEASGVPRSVRCSTSPANTFISAESILPLEK